MISLDKITLALYINNKVLASPLLILPQQQLEKTYT